MKNKGFTLIELIIVVILLGILLALVLPRLPGMTSAASDNVGGGNYAVLQKQVDAFYYSKCESGTCEYPTTSAFVAGVADELDTTAGFCLDTNYFASGCPAAADTWCVDSKGVVCDTTAALCVTTFTCPAVV